MKYVYYILVVLIAAVGFIVYQFFGDRPSKSKDAAIVVNERVISKDEFKGMKPAHDESKEDFINTIITKELLIQEAQKQGFDKEESFRRSVQNFYEQSLIKALMDKKFSSLKASVTDEEIDRYRAFANKELDITLYTADNANNMKADRFREERKDVAFEDLSMELKGAVIGLKKGEMGSPFQTGEKYIAVKLNDSKPVAGAREPGREAVRQLLIEQKRELMMKEWLDGLRKKATIKVFIKDANGG